MSFGFNTKREHFGYALSRYNSSNPTGDDYCTSFDRGELVSLFYPLGLRYFSPRSPFSMSRRKRQRRGMGRGGSVINGDRLFNRYNTHRNHHTYNDDEVENDDFETMLSCSSAYVRLHGLVPDTIRLEHLTTKSHDEQHQHQQQHHQHRGQQEETQNTTTTHASSSASPSNARLIDPTRIIMRHVCVRVPNYFNLYILIAQNNEFANVDIVQRMIIRFMESKELFDEYRTKYTREFVYDTADQRNKNNHDQPNKYQQQQQQQQQQRQHQQEQEQYRSMYITPPAKSVSQQLEFVLENLNMGLCSLYDLIDCIAKQYDYESECANSATTSNGGDGGGGNSNTANHEDGLVDNKYRTVRNTSSNHSSLSSSAQRTTVDTMIPCNLYVWRFNDKHLFTAVLQHLSENVTIWSNVYNLPTSMDDEVLRFSLDALLAQRARNEELRRERAYSQMISMIGGANSVQAELLKSSNTLHNGNVINHYQSSMITQNPTINNNRRNNGVGGGGNGGFGTKYSAEHLVRMYQRERVSTVRRKTLRRQQRELAKQRRQRRRQEQQQSQHNEDHGNNDDDDDDDDDNEDDDNEDDDDDDENDHLTDINLYEAFALGEWCICRQNELCNTTSSTTNTVRRAQTATLRTTANATTAVATATTATNAVNNTATIASYHRDDNDDSGSFISLIVRIDKTVFERVCRSLPDLHRILRANTDTLDQLYVSPLTFLPNVVWDIETIAKRPGTIPRGTSLDEALVSVALVIERPITGKRCYGLVMVLVPPSVNNEECENISQMRLLETDIREKRIETSDVSLGDPAILCYRDERALLLDFYMLMRTQLPMLHSFLGIERKYIQRYTNTACFLVGHNSVGYDYAFIHNRCTFYNMMSLAEHLSRNVRSDIEDITCMYSFNDAQICIDTLLFLMTRVRSLPAFDLSSVLKIYRCEISKGTLDARAIRFFYNALGDTAEMSRLGFGTREQRLAYFREYLKYNLYDCLSLASLLRKLSFSVFVDTIVKYFRSSLNVACYCGNSRLLPSLFVANMLANGREFLPLRVHTSTLFAVDPHVSRVERLFYELHCLLDKLNECNAARRDCGVRFVGTFFIHAYRGIDYDDSALSTAALYDDSRYSEDEYEDNENDNDNNDDHDDNNSEDDSNETSQRTTIEESTTTHNDETLETTSMITENEDNNNTDDDVYDDNGSSSSISENNTANTEYAPRESDNDVMLLDVENRDDAVIANKGDRKKKRSFAESTSTKMINASSSINRRTAVNDHKDDTTNHDNFANDDNANCNNAEQDSSDNNTGTIKKMKFARGTERTRRTTVTNQRQERQRQQRSRGMMSVPLLSSTTMSRNITMTNISRECTAAKIFQQSILPYTRGLTAEIHLSYEQPQQRQPQSQQQQQQQPQRQPQSQRRQPRRRRQFELTNTICWYDNIESRRINTANVVSLNNADTFADNNRGVTAITENNDDDDNAANSRHNDASAGSGLETPMTQERRRFMECIERHTTCESELDLLRVGEKTYIGGLNYADPCHVKNPILMDYNSFYPSIIRHYELDMNNVAILTVLKLLLLVRPLQKLQSLLDSGIIRVFDYTPEHALHEYVNVRVFEDPLFSDIFEPVTYARRTWYEGIEMKNVRLIVTSSRRLSRRVLILWRKTTGSTVARIVTNALQRRAEWKRLRKANPDDKVLESRELMEKLLANGTYGYLNFKRSVIFSRATAAAVTLLCRNAFARTRFIVESWEMLQRFDPTVAQQYVAKVNYIDTDGCIVSLHRRRQEEMLSTPSNDEAEQQRQREQKGQNCLYRCLDVYHETTLLTNKCDPRKIVEQQQQHDNTGNSNTSSTLVARLLSPECIVPHDQISTMSNATNHKRMKTTLDPIVKIENSSTTISRYLELTCKRKDDFVNIVNDMLAMQHVTLAAEEHSAVAASIFGRKKYTLLKLQNPKSISVALNENTGDIIQCQNINSDKTSKDNTNNNDNGNKKNKNIVTREGENREEKRKKKPNDDIVPCPKECFVIKKTGFEKNAPKPVKLLYEILLRNVMLTNHAIFVNPHDRFLAKIVDHRSILYAIFDTLYEMWQKAVAREYREQNARKCDNSGKDDNRSGSSNSDNSNTTSTTTSTTSTNTNTTTHRHANEFDTLCIKDFSTKIPLNIRETGGKVAEFIERTLREHQYDPGDRVQVLRVIPIDVNNLPLHYRMHDIAGRPVILYDVPDASQMILLDEARDKLHAYAPDLRAFLGGHLTYLYECIEGWKTLRENETSLLNTSIGIEPVTWKTPSMFRQLVHLAKCRSGFNQLEAKSSQTTRPATTSTTTRTTTTTIPSEPTDATTNYFNDPNDIDTILKCPDVLYLRSLSAISALFFSTWLWDRVLSKQQQHSSIKIHSSSSSSSSSYQMPSMSSTSVPLSTTVAPLPTTKTPQMILIWRELTKDQREILFDRIRNIVQCTDMKHPRVLLSDEILPNWRNTQAREKITKNNTIRQYEQQQQQQQEQPLSQHVSPQKYIYRAPAMYILAEKFSREWITQENASTAILGTSSSQRKNYQDNFAHLVSRHNDGQTVSNVVSEVSPINDEHRRQRNENTNESSLTISEYDELTKNALFAPAGEPLNVTRLRKFLMSGVILYRNLL